MKRIFLICIGSVALALTGLGAQKDRPTTRSVKGKSAPRAHTVSARGGGHVAPVRTSRSYSAARSHQSAIAATSRARSSSLARARTLQTGRVEAARERNTRVANARTTAVARNRAAISRERSLARASTLRTNRVEAARLRNARTAQANAKINGRRNLAANRGRNLTLGRNAAINRASEAPIVNRWRNDRFRGSNYAAFYNYNRQWHDRTWWRNHHSRIIFVLGGWWYWNAGYWYPTWGYDPYVYYRYDGPIYGYGDLTPDQIIVNVQVALQRDGYYAGPTDGVFGS